MIKKKQTGITFFIDGGSRGNPGPAGYGVIVQDGRGEPIDRRSEFLGITTNNVAEYSGLLAALEYAVQNHLSSVRIFSDSELLVRQMKGQYRVKSPDLLPLFQRAQELVRQIPDIHLEHVPREKNRAADALANEAMDHGEGKRAPARTIHFEGIVENGRIRPLSTIALPEMELVECSVRVKNK